MRSSRRLLLWMPWLWLCLIAAMPAHADTRVAAQALSVPGVTLKQLRVDLGRSRDGQLQMTLTAGEADIPALGWTRVGLSLQGRLRRLHDTVWSCRGSISLDGAPGGLLHRTQPFVLTIDTAANTLELDLGPVPRPLLSMAMPLDQLTHVQTQLFHLPLAWLQGPLRRVLNGRLTAGTVSGTVASDFDAAGVQGSALLTIAGADFDGGSVASQHLNFKGRVNFNAGDNASTTNVTGDLRGGEILLGPVYANLPQRAVQLGFSLQSGGGLLRLRRLQFTDPDALTFAGSLDLGAHGDLRRLSLQRFHAQLPAAYKRYGKTLLATHGWRNLATSGDLSGAVSMTASGWRLLKLHATALNLADGEGRMRIDGLSGRVDWHMHGTRPATRIAWKGLDLFRVPLGAGSGRLQSRDGLLSLQAPTSVPLLGGQLRLLRFAWRPPAGEGPEVDLSAAIHDVDMARLSRALGWPAFQGTLAGGFPGLHYAKGRVALEGGLSLNVFDGYVDVTRMSLAHAFSDTPELAADIDFRQLDLGAMTRVFDFGRITGRMHGKIDGLHLVDWSPVSFKAELHADAGGRISQRAVNNLTKVGGGGIAGGLQGAMLRLFKSFRYARIGLTCTLSGNTCRMGGLKPHDGGYMIVDGRGLPHLTVIGHQRQVSWPTLVSRLRDAIRNGGPQVHGP